MIRNDLLHYCEEGQVLDLETFLISQKLESSQLSQGIFKCLEGSPFSADHLKKIELLLRQKPDLSCRDSKGLSILQSACFKGKSEVVKLLLNEKPDLSQVDIRGRNYHCIALLNESRDPVDILKLLHDSGVSIHTKDMFGAVPLHYAANKGHKLSCQFLIEKGADLNSFDTFLDTPLHIAFRKDKAEIVQLLLPGSNLFLTNNQGKNPTDEAHGRSLEILNSFNRQKALQEKNGGMNEKKHISECFQCKILTEVFCLTCAEDLLGMKNSGPRIKELENSLESSKRENHQLQGKLEKMNAKLNPICLKGLPRLKKDYLVEKLDRDIKEFSKMQEHYVNSVKSTYKEVITIIKECIEGTLKNSKVEAYGSLATGLFLPYSDIDLMITNDKYKPSASLLEKIIEPLELLGIVKSIEKIFNAKIPLIKVQVYEAENAIKIDISVNEDKHKGKECVYLVNSFISKYPEIKPVFLILKQLMFVCGFNEPFKGGISSYALLLMIVSFYQNKFKARAGRQQSEILLGFLEFYTEQYDYSHKIVVDYEGWDAREMKNLSFSDSYNEGSLDIPDPLNPRNNVAHLTDIQRLYVRSIQGILLGAKHILFKPSLCNCEDSSSLISKLLYECMYNTNPENH